MHRWYMELPKYAKESKHSPDGQQIDKVKRQFLRMLKQNIGTHTLLFERLPILITGQADCNVEIADAVAEIKFFYDQILGQLESTFCKEVKKLFGSEQDDAMMEKNLCRVWFPNGQDSLIRRFAISFCRWNGQNAPALLCR